MRYPRTILASLAAGALALTAACSSTSGSSQPPVLPSAVVAAAAAVAASTAPASTAPQAPPAALTTSPGASTPTPIDPCKKLTIADVQPYFTVPVATEMPSPLSSGTMLGCEWAAAGGGGLSTSLDMLVIVGQDAQDRWDLANATGHPEKLSGIGAESEHLARQTDMWAMTGSGAKAVWCGVTTGGWKELAGHRELADPANIPDDVATRIAGQYGLLCNKIFGSGNTTPTMTAPAPTGSAAAVTAPGPTAAAAAAGGVMTGTDVPVPQGMDCSGTKTAKNTTGGLECDQQVPDPDAAYNFFLQALPKAGYVINTKRYVKTDSGRVLANISFSGGKLPGFNVVNIDAKDVDITLQLN